MIFEYKGRKIYYTVFGKGKPLMFLHGWQHSGDIWNPLIERLGPDYTCISVDLPGFGRSEIPQKAFTLKDYANVVQGLLRELDLKDTTLIGHSLGGRIAVKLGSQAKSEKVRKIILIDSGGLRPHKDFKWYLAYALAKVGGIVFSFPGFTRLKQKARRSLYGAIGETDYLESGELRETFLNIINEDLSEDLKKIELPCLVIWGDQDRELPLRYGTRMHRLLKDSKLRIVNFAGHAPFLEYPDKVTRIIKKFLKTDAGKK